MGMILQGIIMISVAALIGGAGYLVRYRGMLGLLAGYDESKVKDRDGLQRFAGNGILALGGILLVGGVLTAASSRWETFSIAVLTATWIIFVIATFALVIGAQRFTR